LQTATTATRRSLQGASRGDLFDKRRELMDT